MRGTEEERLAEIRKWETLLFGSATQGCGRFLIRWVGDAGYRQYRRNDLRDLVGGYERAACADLDAQTWRRGGGVAYLAGQGLTSWQSGIGPVDSRHSIPPGEKFKFVVESRRSRQSAGFPLDDNLDGRAPTLLDAIDVFGLIGGLGARSRRGFGSVRLTSVEPTNALAVATSAESFRERLKALVGSAARTTSDAQVGDIPFTAFSRFSSAVAIDGNPGWLPWQIHADVGHWFQLHRSNGFRSGKSYQVNGVPARSHYADDKAWMWDVINHDRSDRRPQYSGRRLPARLILGLPHAYGTRNAPRNQAVVNISPEGRRASPLFLHVHRFADSPPVAVWLLLPGRFMAGQSNGQVELKVFDKRKVGDIWQDKSGPWPERYSVDYSPIASFLHETINDNAPRASALVWGAAT